MPNPAPTTSARSHLRSLYRAFLRELPPPHHPLPPPPTTTSPSPLSPLPLRHRLRLAFTTSPTSSNPSPRVALRQRQEAEQHLHYIRAQRIYATLLERYNPGVRASGSGGMGEEEEEAERIRLTAKRVGMVMPRRWDER